MRCVIFSVMLVLLVGTIVWAIYFDTLQAESRSDCASAEPNISTIASATRPAASA